MRPWAISPPPWIVWRQQAHPRRKQGDKEMAAREEQCQPPKQERNPNRRGGEVGDEAGSRGDSVQVGWCSYSVSVQE